MKKIIAVWVGLFAMCAAFAINHQEWVNYGRYEAANKNVSQPKVVFMGDSITDGWAAVDPMFFAENGFVGRGIGGQCTSQMLIRFRRDVVDLKPQAVVILAGTNDIAQNDGYISLENIFSNIVSMCEIAKANNITPVLCSILPAFEYKWNPSIRPIEPIAKLNDMIKKYAEENGIAYVDYYSELADERKGLSPAHAPDEVHPNLECYKEMEAILMKTLKPILK